MKYLLPVFLLALLSMNSCKEDECVDVKLDLTSLEAQYGCNGTESQLEFVGSDNILIITNQADFDAKIGGTCTPDIDFTKYMLLAGKQTLTNGLDNITYELIDDCDGDDYDFNINIKIDATAVAPEIVYHALTPILSGEGQVNFNVSISN